MFKSKTNIIQIINYIHFTNILITNWCRSILSKKNKFVILDIKQTLFSSENITYILYKVTERSWWLIDKRHRSTLSPSKERLDPLLNTREVEVIWASIQPTIRVKPRLTFITDSSMYTRKLARQSDIKCLTLAVIKVMSVVVCSLYRYVAVPL